jgi:thioredoxin 1
MFAMYRHLLSRTLAGLFLTAALVHGGTGDAGPPVFDERAFAEAKQAAVGADKWFIVSGSAEWCMPCQKMDQTTWRDEKIVNWLEKHAIAVAVDVDDQKELAQKLSIEAMPTIIAWKDGKEFDRVVGYQSPKAFLRWLQGIARGQTSVDQLREQAGARGDASNKIDIQARLDRARKLIDRRAFKTATDEYVWLWENMTDHNPAYAAVRMSFTAHQMERLADQHPPAKKRFTQLRDELARSLKNADLDRIDRLAVQDWVVLNKVIGDTQATLAWIEAIKDKRAGRKLISDIDYLIKDLLVEEGKWADLALAYRNPLQSLEQDHANVARELRRFREQAGQVYAALLAADRHELAEQVAERARTLDDSPTMVIALISTALKADEPRSAHLQWLADIKDADEDVKILRKEVEAALEQRDSEQK